MRKYVYLIEFMQTHIFLITLEHGVDVYGFNLSIYVCLM